MIMFKSMSSLYRQNERTFGTFKQLKASQGKKLMSFYLNYALYNELF